MTENNQNNTKSNPARRGRGGGGGRNRGRKNYASEGDALFEMPTPSGSYPATPMKIYTGSPSPAPQSANPRSTNKKNFKKNRQTNFSTTPDPAEPGQRTPPATDPVATRLAFASSSSAFANSSSFHSPAPNTLPRPVFAFMTTKSESNTSTRDGAPGRETSESVIVQQCKELTSAGSDSEAPSPSQQTGARIQQKISEFSLEDRFNAERDRIQRANSAHAAVPFSAPSRSQVCQLNDNPIPISLPQRPAQRGLSDLNGAPDSAIPSDLPGRFIRQSMPHTRHPQPHMDRCSPQPTQAQMTQPNMQHFSPQHAQAQVTQPHRQHFSPHISHVHAAEPRIQRLSQHEQSSAVQPNMRYSSQQAQAQAAHYHMAHSSPQNSPAHVNQQHQPASIPPLDPSDALKSLLWNSPASTPQAPPVHTSGPSNSSATPCSAPSCGPYLRGGGSGPATSASTVGGPDNRKSLAEDALRKVLGLSFPLSMSTRTGFDGNHSPQSRYPGHA